MVVYSAVFRDRRTRPDDDSVVVGVWTTFTMALEQLRDMKQHEDDEWQIRQYYVNSAGHGVCVWDSYTDKNRQHAKA